MKDVTALMGKLKAKVGYQQFGDDSGEDLTKWPVLRQAAEARDQAAGAAGDARAQIPVTDALATAPKLPAPRVAPARAAPGKLLQRYAGSDPAAADRSAQDGRRTLSDVFAKLERKTR